MSVSDAVWQRWLERPNHRCVLIRLTFLGAVIGSPSASAEYHVHIANMPYVSRATDSLPNQIFEACVVDIPSFTRRMSEQLEGRSTQSAGDLIVSNEYTLDDNGQVLVAGVRDDWKRMVWLRIEQWLGDPSWPFDDFRQILDGFPTVYDAGGHKIGFRIGDKGTLLSRPVITTLLGGSGPDADKVAPYLIGNFAANLQPRLYDLTGTFGQEYILSLMDSGGIVEELSDSRGILVFEDRNPLSGDRTGASVNAGTDTITASADHGFFENTRLRFSDSGAGLPGGLAVLTDYWVVATGLTATEFMVSATPGGSPVNLTSDPGAFGITYYNWTQATVGGMAGFWVAGNPSGLITVTTWGLRGTSGAIRYSPGDLISEALSSDLTNTPLSSSDIDATNFAAVKTMLGVGKQVTYFLRERITFEELFDKLMLTVGGWWGFSRGGLLQIGRLDLPSAGTPAYSFIDDDIEAGSMKLLRLIPPRAQVKLLADVNWTVQTVFAGTVDQSERAIYSKAGVEYLGAPTISSWEDDPTSHRDATYPDAYQTYFPQQNAGTQAEADRLATLFQRPTGIWGFQTHHAAYLLNLGDLIYVEAAAYTGYGIVVGITDRIKGRSEVQFFAQHTEVYPTADIA